MKRNTKEKEERRQELIDTAKQFFIENGYEKTAVSDIVRKIGIAQGTFYYHFKSKLDILKAIAENINADMKKDLQNIANQKALDPVVKINYLFNRVFTLAKGNEEFIEMIHMETNVVLHEQSRKTVIEMLVPIVNKIICKGRYEGKFDCIYDTETAEILVAMLLYMMHQFTTTITPERRKRIKISTEQAVIKILGIKDHSFILEI